MEAARYSQLQESIENIDWCETPRYLFRGSIWGAFSVNGLIAEDELYQHSKEGIDVQKGPKQDCDTDIQYIIRSTRITVFYSAAATDASIIPICRN